MKKFSYWHWDNLISKERILEINQLIEKMIMLKPEQWIWSHNRWK